MFKNKYKLWRKSLSQHFQRETYQYVSITWLLLTAKHLRWRLFLILSIAKFLRAPILKNMRTADSENVSMKLRKIKIYI